MGNTFAVVYWEILNGGITLSPSKMSVVALEVGDFVLCYAHALKIASVAGRYRARSGPDPRLNA